MKWTIEKPKSPKGQSYVLKTASLQEMLSDAGIATAVHLIYRPFNKAFSKITLLSCYYWLPNGNVPYSRFYISVSAVAFEDRKMADELMQLRILPELISWMQNIVAQPEDSTSIHHNMLFIAMFENGEAKITHD